MLIRKGSDVKSSEITPKDLYMRRREFIRRTGLAGLGLAAGAAGPVLLPSEVSAQSRDGRRLPHEKGDPAFDTEEQLTPWTHVTGYNNFYEFGTDKRDPQKRAGDWSPGWKEWTVQVDGECNKPGTFAVEDLMRPHTLVERIYRLRCVEAWSMVVPWVGVPMGEVLKRFEPNGNAAYVLFETLHDPEVMPGQKSRVLAWPYVEGLRMDEATHPLTLFGVGVYGEVLPGQNGAPFRMICPWKYGFKSIKSIVRISFTRRQPRNSWQRYAPTEYGFYANVNPEVDHPRWSQASERRIDGSFLGKRIETRMFNGYADQVGSLYEGMDLKKNF